MSLQTPRPPGIRRPREPQRRRSHRLDITPGVRVRCLGAIRPALLITFTSAYWHSKNTDPGVLRTAFCVQSVEISVCSRASRRAFRPLAIELPGDLRGTNSAAPFEGPLADAVVDAGRLRVAVGSEGRAPVIRCLLREAVIPGMRGFVGCGIPMPSPARLPPRYFLLPASAPGRHDAQVPLPLAFPTMLAQRPVRLCSSSFWFWLDWLRVATRNGVSAV